MHIDRRTLLTHAGATTVGTAVMGDAVVAALKVQG